MPALVCLPKLLTWKCLDHRYVDDVLIDAPYEVSRTMMKSLGVSLVVSGSISDAASVTDVDAEKEDTCYRAAKDRGKYKELKSVSDVTVGDIVGRILQNEHIFQPAVGSIDKWSTHWCQADVQCAFPVRSLLRLLYCLTREFGGTTGKR